MSNPMDDIHALMRRVAAEADDLADVADFRIIPRTNGPDLVACTFRVKGEALKSTEEIASDQLEDDFFAVLGDMTAEEDDEGNAILAGGGEAADEESVEDREAREALRAERLKKILDSRKPKGDDEE